MITRIDRFVASGAIAALRLYRRFISPALPQACRFVPTCSEYAIEALRKHGILKGSALAFRRLLKCHPLGGSGLDQVR